MAVLAWGLGAVATPLLARAWLRERRPALGLVVLAAMCAMEVVWLARAATAGMPALLDPADRGDFTQWTLGVVGSASLVQVVPRPSLDDTEDAFRLGLGFLGLGYLFRQLALIL
jgi:hypothetical protein